MRDDPLPLIASYIRERALQHRRSAAVYPSEKELVDPYAIVRNTDGDDGNESGRASPGNIFSIDSENEKENKPRGKKKKKQEETERTVHAGKRQKNIPITRKDGGKPSGFRIERHHRRGEKIDGKDGERPYPPKEDTAYDLPQRDIAQRIGNDRADDGRERHNDEHQVFIESRLREVKDDKIK